MRKDCAPLGNKSCCFYKRNCPSWVQRRKNKYFTFPEVKDLKNMNRPLSKTRRDPNALHNSCRLLRHSILFAPVHSLNWNSTTHRVHCTSGTQSVKSLLDIIYHCIRPKAKRSLLRSICYRSVSSYSLPVFHIADMVEIIFLATECLALVGVIPLASILLVFESIICPLDSTGCGPHDGLLRSAVDRPR